MQSLRMLHPVTPFVTEELYQKLGDEKEQLIMDQCWPDVTGISVDDSAKEELNWVVRLVSEIRSVRATMNVPASAKVPLLSTKASARTADKLKMYESSICRLARLSTIKKGNDVGKGAAQIVFDETTLFLVLGEVIDVAKERARLQKELSNLEGEARKIRNKLSNDKFLTQAPRQVIEEQRERLVEAEMAREKLEEAVERLSSV